MQLFQTVLQSTLPVAYYNFTMLHILHCQAVSINARQDGNIIKILYFELDFY